jgi:copper(I)-binding protein
MIVGNKKDLEENRVVEMTSKFAQENGKFLD